MDSDCSGNNPLCDTGSGKCVQCRTSNDCSGLTPLCVAATSTCGPCTGDGPAGGCVDPARPACNTVLPLAGACTECSMTNTTRCGGAKPQCLTQVGLCGCSDRDGDSECGGNLSGIICNGPVGICTPGCSEAPMRNRCPSPQMCSVPGGPVGTCVVPACISDLDCRVPRPKCDVAASPRACVGCLMDTDCATGYVCDSPGTKTCVECTQTKTTNCSATNSGSRCLANSTCGCTADSDCGTNISGRVCDAMVNKCTYGCRGIGGNGCPAGLICTSTTNDIGRCLTPGAADAGVDASPDAAPDATPDMAVAMADAADDAAADAAADVAAEDAAPDLAADVASAPDVRLPDAQVIFPPPPDAAPPQSDDSGIGGNVPRGTYVAGGGCRCETGHASSGVGMWPALLLPIGLLVRRRRRR
jgi:MYXO-CTERM domain-containing protein